MTTNKWIQFCQKHAKLLISLCIILVIAAFAGVLLLQKINEPKVKRDVFVFEVNTELDDKASAYLENIDDEKAGINFKDVNIHKVGTYQGYVVYDGLLYDINFDIKDRTAPVLATSNERYVFSLYASVEEVNEAINNDITITDNYELDYAPLNVIESMPIEEKELTVRLSISDKSENRSNEVTITIQFTEDGVEKEELPKEDVIRQLSSTAQADTSTPKEETPPVENPEEEPEEAPQEEPTQEPTEEPKEPTGNSNANTQNPNNQQPTQQEPTPTPPATDPKPTPEPTPDPEPAPEPEPEPEPAPPVTDPEPDNPSQTENNTNE